MSAHDSKCARLQAAESDGKMSGPVGIGAPATVLAATGGIGASARETTEQVSIYLACVV